MLFFLIATSILIFSYSYIGFRLIVPLKVHVLWKTIFWSILILLLPMTPVYLVFRKNMTGGLWWDVLPWLA
jgi:hypothetical protein